jgi:aspartate 1-decarboxylase
MAERGFDYNQLIAPGIGAGAAFVGSIPQMVEARRLRKERERLLKEGAPGMSPIEQEQMAAARARAASSLAPGYGQEMENIAEQQSNVLGAAKKAGITGSNIMNALSRLNQQGQAARRNLAIRGAQAQRAAQGDLADISMTADARRQNRVQNWEAKLAAMDAARRQYNTQAGMSPLQGALAFMPAEGFKMGTGALKPTPASVTFNPETDTQFGPMDAGDGAPMSGANMRQAVNTEIGGPLNMKEDIGYDPYKEPLRNYPATKKMYDNMFDSNAAARRMNMRSQMLRTSPYYNFGQ